MDQASPLHYCDLPKQLASAFEFLNRIGIPTHLEPGAKGFVDGLRIEEGELYVDPACPPSALLHEAGHLAIVPAQYRSWMSGNLYRGLRCMMEDVATKYTEPDSPLYRAAVQSSDPEATAWAWAAGMALGFDPVDIILDEDYDGDGESIRLSLQIGHYVGINGMAFAGFCSVNKRGRLPAFPSLAFWTQPLLGR